MYNVECIENQMHFEPQHPCFKKHVFCDSYDVLFHHSWFRNVPIPLHNKYIHSNHRKPTLLYGGGNKAIAMPVVSLHVIIITLDSSGLDVGAEFFKWERG